MIKRIFYWIGLLLISASFVTACSNSAPEGLQVIEGFEPERYIGTWYEIARLENRFEKGLDKISAVYSLRDDGGIDVLNQGWQPETGEWQKAVGVARFIDTTNKGSLKVSFFQPFYGGYHIIALDKDNYSYAMVTGNDKSYFWILSRTKTLPKTVLDSLLAKAKQAGFETDKLIFVKHD